MFFPLKVALYRSISNALKYTVRVLPISPPIIFSGKDSSVELANAIAQRGHDVLLLVTDEVLMKIGLADRVIESLEANGVKVVIYSGVLPDPTTDHVDEGVRLALDNHCDGILSVGGGSPIDTAKAIAACVTNNKKAMQLSGLFKVKKTPLPLYVVPTTAGTGSEATIASVITNAETHKKELILDPSLVPKMAALDGQLMLNLPASVTAASGMDALTHAIEAYVSTNATNETDSLALTAAKLIFNNIEKTVIEGQCFDARQNMALGSYYAGAAFTKAGVGYVHAISHSIGGQYGTVHGVLNSMILPRVLAYSLTNIESRLATISRESGIADSNASDGEASERLINKIKQLVTTFDMPYYLDDLKSVHIKGIAKQALKEAHYTPYAVPKYMDQSACESLIRDMQTA